MNSETHLANGWCECCHVTCVAAARQLIGTRTNSGPVYIHYSDNNPNKECMHSTCLHVSPHILNKPETLLSRRLVLVLFWAKPPIWSQEINTLFVHFHMVFHYFLALRHRNLMTSLALPPLTQKWMTGMGENGKVAAGGLLHTLQNSSCKPAHESQTAAQAKKRSSSRNIYCD